MNFMLLWHIRLEVYCLSVQLQEVSALNIASRLTQLAVPSPATTSRVHHLLPVATRGVPDR